jgi:hypothetical protein
MGESVVFTNLRRLADFIDGKKSYNRLLEHFSRKKKVWYENPYEGIIVIKSLQIIKGDQKPPKEKAVHSINFKK